LRTLTRLGTARAYFHYEENAPTEGRTVDAALFYFLCGFLHFADQYPPTETMITMTHRILLLCLTALLFLSLGNTLYAQKTPQNLALAFLSDYEWDGPNQAINKLYATNPWVSASSEQVQRLRNDLEALDDGRLGDFFRYELLLKKNISESYVVISYLIKYEKEPVRFTFQFYKSDLKWMIYRFDYDRNLDEELYQAVKLNFQDLNE